jgi:hypothetical protein
MKLNVPVVKQERGSNYCGLAGLGMIFKYYNIPTSLKELKKDIKVYEIGTYAPQLGNYMIKKGLKIEIITMHPSLFTLKDKQHISKSVLIKRFKKMKKKSKLEKNKITLAHFITFLQNGGKILVKIPDRKDIEKEIRNKRPIGALLTSNFLKGKDPRFNFHFNMITGIDKKYIYANDPLPDYRGGKQRYKIEDFFYGLFASAYGDLDNACLIKIRK